jgi:hypothetical protein
MAIWDLELWVMLIYWEDGGSRRLDVLFIPTLAFVQGLFGKSSRIVLMASMWSSPTQKGGTVMEWMM